MLWYHERVENTLSRLGEHWTRQSNGLFIPQQFVPFPVPIQHSFKVLSPCHASTSCFADCSCSYCCFLLLTTCLSLTVTAFPLDIPFSLSRAIKGNETGKPKLSPAGKCLPIPKPFRSSLFRGGTSLHSPWRKQVCGYVDDNRPIRTFVCWNLLLSESFGKPWWSHIIIIINSFERKLFLQGKASFLSSKSWHGCLFIVVALPGPARTDFIWSPFFYVNARSPACVERSLLPFF